MAGSSLRIYQLKAQKADSFEYLCLTKKTTILMCNMEGQCCFQNTGPKVESQGKVVNFRVFLTAVYKQARMCWIQEDELNGNQPRPRKKKQTNTVTQKSCM